MYYSEWEIHDPSSALKIILIIEITIGIIMYMPNDLMEVLSMSFKKMYSLSWKHYMSTLCILVY